MRLFLQRISIVCCLMLVLPALAGAEDKTIRDLDIEEDNILRNNKVQITFASGKRGFACRQIAEVSGSATFVRHRDFAQYPGLWNLHFLALDQKERIVLTSLSPSYKRAKEISRPDGSLEFRFIWEGLALAGEENVVEVVASIKLLPDGTSHWKIDVNNSSHKFGLYSVEYPILSQVARPGTADVIFHGGILGGILRRNNRASRLFRYPSEAWGMQFLSFVRDGKGLYLGAHDPNRRPKQATLTPAQDVIFRFFPEAMGQPQQNFTLDFPVVIKIHSGDWWDAAKIHREWVLQQPWKISTLLRDRDLPTSFKEACIWMITWQSPYAVARYTLKAQRYFQVPMGIFWCEWGIYPFDKNLPKLFPARSGMRENVRKLKNHDIVVMPYINPRVWGTDNKEFTSTAVQQGLAKGLDTDPRKETPGTGIPLAVMCPGSEFWRERMSELTNRLLNEIGVNAIYFDQVGAAIPVACFHPEHGHPPGYAHWVESNSIMIANTRKQAQEPIALITESAVDGYDFDGMLMCWWNPTHNFEEAIPLIMAVYAGRVSFIPLVSNAIQNFQAYIMIQGRFFLWGMPLPLHQNEFEGREPWPTENREEAHAFVRRAAQLRLAAREFMIHGQLLGQAQPIDNPSIVSSKWNSTGNVKTEVQFPAIKASVWQALDGSLGIAVINFSGEQQEFTFDLDDFLPGQDIANRKLVEITAMDATGGRVSWANSLITGKLLPQQVRFLSLTAPGIK